MKVLIVSTSDKNGGAFITANRLHKALLLKNIDSKMLVLNKYSDDYLVLGPKSKLEKFINLIRGFIDSIPVLLYKKRKKILFSPAWLPNRKIIKRINKLNPDIVNLHWICGGMLKIEDIKKITPPIVWTLHDMWAFTGGEHYGDTQESYLYKSGKSIVLGSSKENDLSRKVWKRKQKTYSKIKNLTVVTPSNWLNKCSRKSSLLKNREHHVIPNALDTELYKPIPKKTTRLLWKLPTNKKLILFGAINSTKDPNKGFKEIIEAIKNVKHNNIELVVFGSEKPQNAPNYNKKVHYVGKLYDDVSLVSLYNSADVVVVPSKIENLNTTVCEAFSCEVPVVAFNTTGLVDIIEHKKNGFLAKPFCPIDLAKGIDWVLSNKNYNSLCKEARKKAVNNYDNKVVTDKYIKLYSKIKYKK